MTIVGAPSAPIPAVAAPRSLVASVLVPMATVVLLIALAVLPLLTPPLMHAFLDASRAHDWLGTTPAVAHGLSDATVTELVLGPGTFAISAPDGRPLYDPAEAAHLRDARLLLWLLLGSGIIVAAALAVRLRAVPDRARTWRGIARGGAIAALGAIVVGGVGVVAFDPLFELFHRVFFPGGNWAFDPRTQHLVQLYPYAFWELAATGLGIGLVVLGSLTWALGRRASQRSSR
jgi:hypothetical protein